jgi:hypothetical protein
MRTALRDDAFSEGFFVSEQGHALTQKALGSGLAQLGRQLGLESTAGGRRPRLPYARPVLLSGSAAGIRTGSTGRLYCPPLGVSRPRPAPRKLLVADRPPLHA